MLRHDTRNTVWPCSDRIAHERIFGLQVEDVELVDAGRDDDQRPRIHLLAVCGAYWISCISSFSNTTAPGVTAMFLPTSNAALVGHRDAALGQVLRRRGSCLRPGFVRRSPAQAVSPRDWRPGNSPGLSHRCTGGRQRCNCPSSCRRSGRLDRVLQRIRIAQVHLLHRVEARIVAPGLARESLVVRSSPRIGRHCADVAGSCNRPDQASVICLM